MSVQSRSTLKSYFITGASPSESDFGDLIDSSLLVEDIVTSLTSTSTTDPLAASSGKILNDSIASLTARVSSLEDQENTFSSNYYTKTEVDTKLDTIDALLDPLVVANFQSQIDELQTQIDSIDTGGGSPSSISISDVTGLQSSLDLKASIAELNSVRDNLIASINAIETGDVDLSGINASIDSLNSQITDLQNDLLSKADSGHIHSDIYTKTEVDSIVEGLDLLDHTHVAADITDLGTEIQQKTNLLVDDHANLQNNPHNVTKEQIGLGNVENLSANQIIAIAGGVSQQDVDAVQQNLEAHLSSTNPHGISKVTLGLTNVPNIDPRVLLEDHLAEDNPHGIDLSYFDVYATAEADARTVFHINSVRYAFTPLANNDSAGAVGDFAYDQSNLYFKTGSTQWMKLPFSPVYIQREATQEDVDAGIATNVGEIITVNEVELPELTQINITENFNITNNEGDQVFNITEEGDIHLTSTSIENITIEGDTIINENISSSTQQITIQDNTTIQGDTIVQNNDFSVTNVNDQNVFNVTNEGDVTIAGDTIINESLSIIKDGSSVFNVTNTGDTTIAGDTVVNQTLEVNGGTSINNTLDVSGNTTIDQNLTVSGETNLSDISVTNSSGDTLLEVNQEGDIYISSVDINAGTANLSSGSIQNIDTQEVEFIENWGTDPTGEKLIYNFNTSRLNIGLSEVATLSDLTSFVTSLELQNALANLDLTGGSTDESGNSTDGSTETDIVLDGTTGGVNSGYAVDGNGGFYAIDYGADNTYDTADDIDIEYWALDTSSASSTGLVINLGYGQDNPYLRYDVILNNWQIFNGGSNNTPYDIADSYSKVESDNRYYTKTDSDSTFAEIGDSYTKTESDNKYALISNTYTRSVADNKYALQSRVAMTDGSGGTSIIANGVVSNQNLNTGLEVDYGSGNNPYIHFNPTDGKWYAYNGVTEVEIGAVVNNTTINEGDTVTNTTVLNQTIVQQNLTVDGTSGGAESGYAYTEYDDGTGTLVGEKYSIDYGADSTYGTSDDDDSEDYWDVDASGYQNAGLTVNAGLDPNPSIKYDGTSNMWLVENGEQGTTDYGSFFLKDVDAAVSALVDSAPNTLNTLNELASALGDDPNFATTTSTALGNRVRVDVNNQNLTTAEKTNARTNIGAQVAGSYASSTHNHDSRYARFDASQTLTAANKTQILTNIGAQASGSYAASSHTHDDRYYTETEMRHILSRAHGWASAYGTSSEGATFWDQSEDALRIWSNTDSSTGATYKAIRIRKGDIVRFTVMVKGSANSSSGLYLRIYGDTALDDLKTHISGALGETDVQVVSTSSGTVEHPFHRTNWQENQSISTSWKDYTLDYVAHADGFISLVILNWSGHGFNSLYVKNPDIQVLASGQYSYAT